MATRGLVVARDGIAATSQPLATAAALGTLGRGGSFADAAIAASAVLCVIEPWNSQLGGDAFLIVHEAQTRENIALNASGAAPQAAATVPYAGGIPVRGARSATVPGLVDAWATLHARWGRLPFATLLEPAIRYAEEGYPAGPRAVKKFAEHATLFSQCPTLAALGTVAPKLGDLVRQQELAWTLKEIATGGGDAFYRGEIAARIVRASAGYFSAEDLAAHRTRVMPPLTVSFNGLDVHCQPPPSQGIILAEELRLASGFDLAALTEAERTHLLVECKKLAFADRNAYLADPEWREIPVDALLSEDYVRTRREKIGAVAGNFHAGTLPNEGQDTTYFLVADADGNAVSFIQSIFHNFGSGWIADGTGILFNNRLTGFSLDPRSPNVLEPGKRPAHTLNAWLATNADGSLAHVGGTPGGHVQVQTNLQLLVNCAVLGLDPQESVEAPRWQHLSAQGAVATEDGGEGVLELENRFTPEVFESLQAQGHAVVSIGAWAHGSAAQLLSVTADSVYLVGSDPRCDGQAGGI